MNTKLINGDCLQEMAKIPDESVDMVLCDLPYGTTACKWDTVIPFEPLWAAYKRVCKKNAAIVLTASQPFTSLLVASNVALFRHGWVWEKEQGVNFQLAKIQPLKTHEDVLVFGHESPRYNPQGLMDCFIAKSNAGKGGRLGHIASEEKRDTYVQTKTGYPRSIVKFGRDRGLHPTQKPVALMEYLIRTYTNEGEIVLDNTMGSGTTGVACKKTNRNFIGIELDKAYFDIASKRIAETISNTEPFCLK